MLLYLMSSEFGLELRLESFLSLCSLSSRVSYLMLSRVVYLCELKRSFLLIFRIMFLPIRIVYNARLQLIQ